MIFYKMPYNNQDEIFFINLKKYIFVILMKYLNFISKYFFSYIYIINISIFFIILLNFTSKEILMIFYKMPYNNQDEFFFINFKLIIFIINTEKI